MSSNDSEYLTPGEVARIFRVDPKTVTRWARQGKLDTTRTLGGHRRFRKDQITRLIEEARERSDNDD